jgi:GT2 family glycosyltransferase
MDISVVIVNYNVKYFLDQCLQSVFSAGKSLDMEVFVVDNNSVDGSNDMVAEKYPDVRLIANTENFGFSKANNQAIIKSSGRYVLLLNPDTVIEDDTLQKVVDFMDKNPDAGGLGVKMIDGNGRFLPESKRSLPTPSVAFFKIFGLSALFPKSKTFGRYHLGFLDNKKIHQVEVLSGAFMLLRKETLDKIGYLDEDFFMYGEDIDLSYRITQAGYKNYYFPQTRIIHYKGESTKKNSVNYVLVFYNAMLIFARKHFSSKNAKIFSILIKFAVYLRAGLAILNRLVKSILKPLLDFILIFVGFYFIKLFWETHLFHGTPYPDIYLYLIVPAYIITWLATVYFSGGYDKPIKRWRVVRGVMAGTLAILVVYALLPANLRFSRALILMSSAWAMAALLFNRGLFNFLRKGKKGTDGKDFEKIAIVGSKTEANRIMNMIHEMDAEKEVKIVSLEKESGAEIVGTISQINEIIEIYKINEIIFCAADLSSQKIIDYMSELTNRQVNFKIAPPESLYIIGSNSIDDFGNMFAVSVSAVDKQTSKRKKRLFDLVAALMVIASLPVSIFVVKKPLRLLRNIFLVLAGARTWVGYQNIDNGSILPNIKPGVLFPSDALKAKALDQKTIQSLNNIYAKDYKIENDFNILIAGWRNLGR